MFQQLMTNLFSTNRSADSPDVSKFGDPLAETIRWDPLAQGGTNICTHKLRQIEPNRYEFRPSMMYRFGGVLCLLFGFAGVFFFGKAVITGQAGENSLGMSLGVVFSTIFIGLGAWTFYRMSRPIVFDRNQGLYWKGNEDFAPMYQGQSWTKLDDIYALQLIRELCVSHNNHGRRRYYSYELNLVLSNGKRMHVVDHGNYRRLRSDAQQLAQFLGDIPIWDGT